MFQINDEQAVKLNNAINKATDHGSCRYVKKGTEQCSCVLANLASLEGVVFDVIKRWDELKDNSAIVLFGKKNSPLRNYPLELLVYLQAIWDNKNLSENVARDQMEQLVLIAKSDKYSELNNLAFSFHLTLLNLNNSEL